MRIVAFYELRLSNSNCLETDLQKKDFARFTRKHLRRSLFLIKLQDVSATAASPIAASSVTNHLTFNIFT